jgi:hypothetical protein
MVARDGIAMHYANLKVPMLGIELLPNVEVAA